VNSPSDQFSDSVAGITTLLAAHHDGLTILRAVTDACAATLAADATGVLLTDPRGGVEVLAASDERARIIELFQADFGQGPCLECIDVNATIGSADLGQDPRWREFGATAVELGFHALYAFPLRLIDHAVGGLNLLYTKPTELSDRQLRAAQALADLAVLGLTQEHDQRRVERLAERTLATLNDRAHVNQAVGMLVATSGADPDEARVQLWA
jgi:GAF domain-containing protein